MTDDHMDDHSDDHSDESDRRRFHRILFHAETILARDEEHINCELLDLSLQGMLVRVPEGVKLESSHPLQARIQLSDDAVINMQVLLAWARDQELGLTCDSVDIDSICHLRRLIELNLGDPELAERDLSQLASRQG